MSRSTSKQRPALASGRIAPIYRPSRVVSPGSCGWLRRSSMARLTVADIGIGSATGAPADVDEGRQVRRDAPPASTGVAPALEAWKTRDAYSRCKIAAEQGIEIVPQEGNVRVVARCLVPITDHGERGSGKRQLDAVETKWILACTVCIRLSRSNHHNGRQAHERGIYKRAPVRRSTRVMSLQAGNRPCDRISRRDKDVGSPCTHEYLELLMMQSILLRNSLASAGGASMCGRQ